MKGRNSFKNKRTKCREWKHKILSRSHLLLDQFLLVSGWMLIRLSMHYTLTILPGEPHHQANTLSAGIEDPPTTQSRAIRCCLLLCWRACGSITPASRQTSWIFLLLPTCWECQWFLLAPLKSICHAQSFLTAPCLSGTSRTACWATCLSQAGLLHVSKSVLLFTT